MGAVLTSRAFKSGNSVALRLPKGLGVKPGEAFQITPKGRGFDAQPVLDPEIERAKVLQLIEELDRIGPVPGGPFNYEEERIEFPDRPGLYD